MADKSTFIVLDRNILKWRWYHDEKTKSVFIHLLLTANIKDAPFEDIIVHRGERVISYQTLATDLMMSVRSVRTCLQHLMLTGEVTSRKFPRYQVITIVNYDRYQRIDKVSDSQTTSKRQANDTQTTTNKQYNHITKETNNNIPADQTANAVGGEAEKSPKIVLDENGCDTRIPPMFRDSFKRYEDYWEWRNQ